MPVSDKAPLANLEDDGDEGIVTVDLYQNEPRSGQKSVEIENANNSLCGNILSWFGCFRQSNPKQFERVHQLETTELTRNKR